jgi:hypothetical protein
MMLLSTWAAKNNISYNEVIVAAANKTLSATQNGKMWMIDDKAEDVTTWLHKNHPEVFTTISRVDFVGRFTNIEKIAIASNPQSLIFWLELMNYPTINMENTKLVSDIDGLIAMKLLASDRKAEILASV